jgi:hypothetical protein
MFWQSEILGFTELKWMECEIRMLSKKRQSHKTRITWFLPFVEARERKINQTNKKKPHIYQGKITT